MKMENRSHFTLIEVLEGFTSPPIESGRKGCQSGQEPEKWKSSRGLESEWVTIGHLKTGPNRLLEKRAGLRVRLA